MTHAGQTITLLPKEHALLGGFFITRLGAAPMFLAVGAVMLALGVIGLVFGKQLFGKA